MKQSTVFFGASSYVFPLIELLKKNYVLKLVVTTEQKPTDPVVKYCMEQNIPYLSVTSLTDPHTKYKIQNTGSSFAILADFRLLVSQDIIDIFPKGIINIHPSLLPEYRGPTPGITALLNGKEETGVSLMILDNKLDHGPLLGQENEHILPTDTSVSLYERLFAKGATLLEKVLPDYLNGKLKSTQQDHSKATYTDYLTRESGFFSFNNPPKKEILNRMIHAYYPWPGVWTRVQLSGKEQIVKLLPKKMLQVEGKKPVNYKDFLNGYPHMKQWLEKIVG